MGIMVYSLLWVMQDFVHQQLVTAEELEQHCGEFVKLVGL